MAHWWWLILGLSVALRKGCSLPGDRLATGASSCRQSLSSESCRNTPESGVILHFSTYRDHNWWRETKIEAVVVAEDWSKEGVGLPWNRWETEGSWKGRGESLASSLESVWAGDGCVTSFFFLHCFFPREPKECLLKKKGHPSCGEFSVFSQHGLVTCSHENTLRMESYLLSFVIDNQTCTRAPVILTHSYWGPTIC